MLTANCEYSRSKRDNLSLLIQMQLTKKLETFCCKFIAFLQSTLNFEYFEKNETHSLSISETIDSERRGYRNA